MVRHEGHSYAVIVRAGARHDLPALISERHPRMRVAVIADQQVIDALGSPLPDAPLFTFAPGEGSKNRGTWGALTDQLLAEGYDRRSVIVAWGGGVTTDLAGFVAATFLRGIPWIAVPTTTLGMLDAAVGGKTGVDTPVGKNLVGAFHPPSGVICDPRALRTLPERSYREGLAEAVKHAATLDARYGHWMGDAADKLATRDSDALEELIQQSVQLKADVVMEDEREGDRRAVLNAGHTVAHGLEGATSYTLPHGEAVAMGLVLETRVAEKMGIAVPGTAEQISALLRQVGLPVAIPETIDRERAIGVMRSDKKNRSGVIHGSLVESFGTMARNSEGWTFPLDLSALRELW